MGRPLNIDAAMRPFLEEMRMLNTDLNGDEIFVGLTREESEWYADYEARDWSYRTADHAPRPEKGEKLRHQELWEKHERARFEVLGAEHVLRTENPSRNQQSIQKLSRRAFAVALIAPAC
jgi:hypothetical protein